MLGTLQRSHQQRAALARRMADRKRAQDRHHLADHLDSRARDDEDDALPVRELMRSGFAGMAGGASEEQEAAGGNAEVESRRRG